MKKFAVLAFLLSVLNLKGQTPVGSWSDHLSYSSAVNIAAGTKEIYTSTGSSLIIYNREFDELKKMSAVNGLTETGISGIAWSESYNTLTIGYLNTNIDLLNDNTIYNIPDILNKNIPGTREIHRIRSEGKYSYLACSFGIVVIDLSRKEVNDTWKPGPDADSNPVKDICFGDGRIFAATAKGVFVAEQSVPGLSYFGNWSRINSLPDPDGSYTGVIFSGDRLFVNKSDETSDGDSLFVVNGTSSLFSFIPGIRNLSFDHGSSGFTISSKSFLRYFNTNGSLISTIDTYGFATPDACQAFYDNGDIWIADMSSGLVKGNQMTSFSKMNIPGPLSNNAFHITSLNGKSVISSGAADVSGNSSGRPFEVSVFHEGNWTGIVQEGITDAVRSIIDPTDENHIFVSSWGGGLLEFRDNSLVNNFTDGNSPLQSVIPGKQYVRICGLAIDRQRNLWMTQSGVPGSIKILKADGNWIVNPVTIDAPVIGDIIITRSGYAWIILPGGFGLFILDDNKTPESSGDDNSKRLIVKDSEGQVISSVYSIAEDQDGYIWIGTEQGPLVYYNPDRVFEEDIRAARIKIPRNDGSGLSDYLLRSETVTSIAIDGANGKWLGTLASGSYHLSPEGTVIINKFNTENSPAISDSINSLSVDNKTGDVWFATSAGVQSYRALATEGSEEFANVYAFPNPVREDFDGNVTITGLMKETSVIITDISGNLVYRTTSEGGQATWDMKTYNGKQVTTGVYLIFCASDDGSKAFVTKILVIRK